MSATYPYTLQQFGGADDGATNNSTAVASALSSMPAGATLICPWTAGGDYLFTTANTNLSGVELAPDAGVTFIVNSSVLPFANTSSIRTTQDLKLRFDDLNYDYVLSSDFQAGFEKKRLWLTDADADTSSYQALALSSLINESVAWPNGDVWAASSAGAASGSEPYPYLYWSGLSNVTWYASTVAVRGGDELSASFDTGGLYNRAVFLRTTAGYYCVYAPGGGGAPVLVTKLTGQPATSQTLGAGSPFATQPQYYPENCVWTARLIDRFHFEVLLNGVSLTGPIATAGAIFRAGFGVMTGASVTSMSVTGWAKTQNKPQGGKPPVYVTAYGDSLTADIHGGWPYAMREALDGSAGVRVGAVVNRAVAGYTSAQALAAMQANPPAGSNVCVIGIGTNDIQTGVSVTTCLNNIAAMVALCNSNGALPVIWVCPLWYTQAEAGAGNGQPSGNSGAGSPIRAAIMRYCGAHGIACVDLTQVTGPIDVRYLQDTYGVSGADSMVRDNIHPTAYAYRLIGQAISRRILGLFAPRYSRAVAYQAMNPTPAGLNGWTVTEANYSVSESGLVQLGGVLTNFGGATLSNGTLFMQLPEHLRPLAACRFATFASLSTGAYVTVCVQIDTAGNCTVYGLPSTTNYFCMDNCSYQSAG